MTRKTRESTSASTSEGAARDADRRGRELFNRLHALPCAVRDPRDLVLIVDGHSAPLVIPSERVDLAVRMLCGTGVALAVAALDGGPGTVRVLVVMPRGFVHMNTIGLRVLQKGGAA